MVLELDQVKVDLSESSSLPDMKNWIGLDQVPCNFAKYNKYKIKSHKSWPQLDWVKTVVIWTTCKSNMKVFTTYKAFVLIFTLFLFVMTRVFLRSLIWRLISRLALAKFTPTHIGRQPMPYATAPILDFHLSVEFVLENLWVEYFGPKPKLELSSLFDLGFFCMNVIVGGFNLNMLNFELHF